MTNADLSQNVDLGVDVLLDANGADPVSVRRALRSFYLAVAEAPKDKAVGTAVSQWIAGEMRNRFASCAEHPSVEEHRRFDALCKAFVRIGAELDAFEKDAPEYHNRAHNLFVMASRFLQGRTEEAISGKPFITNQLIDEMVDCNAALGHDLAHNGKNNGAAENYVPGAMEMRSFYALSKCLENAGVSSEDQRTIRLELYGTDPGLPGEIVLSLYERQNKAGLAVPDVGAIVAKIGALPPEKQAEPMAFMEALAQDPALTRRIAALKGHDMALSYGIDGGFWKDQTRAMAQEAQIPILDDAGKPKSGPQKFVMENFIGKNVAGGIQFSHPTLDKNFGEVARGIYADVVAGINQQAPVRSDAPLVGQGIEARERPTL